MSDDSPRTATTGGRHSRPDIPSPARIYDYLHNVKDNYLTGGDEIAVHLPNIRQAFVGGDVHKVAIPADPATWPWSRPGPGPAGRISAPRAISPGSYIASPGNLRQPRPSRPAPP